MEIRPATSADLDALREIDGTVESTDYLHLDQTGEGFSTGWRLDRRKLREKLIESNPLTDETHFIVKQIATGADEGLALVAEHENAPVGLLLAQARYETRTMELIDLRIDYDQRRQGLATAMVFQVVAAARDLQLRAVMARTRTNNFPANQFLLKSAFDLAGIDTRRNSNHDVVKEVATLIWYASLD